MFCKCLIFFVSLALNPTLSPILAYRQTNKPKRRLLFLANLAEMVAGQRSFLLWRHSWSASLAFVTPPRKHLGASRSKKHCWLIQRPPSPGNLLMIPWWVVTHLFRNAGLKGWKQLLSRKAACLGEWGMELGEVESVISQEATDVPCHLISGKICLHCWGEEAGKPVFSFPSSCLRCICRVDAKERETHSQEMSKEFASR